MTNQEAPPTPPFSQIAEAMQNFMNSPCATCDSTAMLHAGAPENPKFGCDKHRVCLELKRLRLCGPPGESGWNGDQVPTESEREQQRLKDTIANAQYWAKINVLEGYFAA